MSKVVLITICIQFLSLNFSLFGEGKFISNHKQLEFYKNRNDTIIVCSPGRSGSGLLTNVLRKSLPNKPILKSHLLPPRMNWKGKILFIFSNPNHSIESAFHKSLDKKKWGRKHFHNMETSDSSWLQSIGNTGNQTIDQNLLIYDALGIEKQLKVWLFEAVQESSLDEANVLAIKYENLWELEVIETIKQFCGLNHFPLPSKRKRGVPLDTISELELTIRETFNYGTFEEPKYAAYNGAREIWEMSPNVQLLKLKE